MSTAAGLAYREAGEPDTPVALLVHGYPQSSHMWRGVLPAVADAGWRAIAPDLAGYGDSLPDPPGTWERHLASIEEFRRALELERVALVVHDWGGLIGLRWACEHPDAVSALVLSNTGFFPDGRWHGMAAALQTPEQGEELLAALDRDGLGALLRQAAPGIGEEDVDEYWKGFADEQRRAGQLELYRSGDFSKLEPYDGQLTALGVPTLLLWGERDEFAPVAGAHRFMREIPGAQLELLDAGHFVFDEQPERAGAAVAKFLSGVARG